MLKWSDKTRHRTPKGKRVLTARRKENRKGYDGSGKHDNNRTGDV